MINTRMGVIAASKASGSIPPGPYTDGTYYYVVRNRVNLWSKRVNQTLGATNPYGGTRWWIDKDTYDVYEKPDSNNTTIINYTYLGSVVNPSGDYTNCQACAPNTLYTDGSGKWLTTVTVTVTNGYPSYSFPDGGTTTRGQNFYTASVLPFIP